MSDVEKSGGGVVEEESEVASQMFRLAKELEKHMATGICPTIVRLWEKDCSTWNVVGARRAVKHY